MANLAPKTERHVDEILHVLNELVEIPDRPCLQLDRRETNALTEETGLPNTRVTAKGEHRFSAAIPEQQGVAIVHGDTWAHLTDPPPVPR